MLYIDIEEAVTGGWEFKIRKGVRFNYQHGRAILKGVLIEVMHRSESCGAWHMVHGDDYDDAVFKALELIHRRTREPEDDDDAVFKALELIHRRTREPEDDEEEAGEVRMGVCIACSQAFDTAKGVHINTDGSIVCRLCYTRWELHPVEVEWIR